MCANELNRTFIHSLLVWPGVYLNLQVVVVTDHHELVVVAVAAGMEWLPHQLIRISLVTPILSSQSDRARVLLLSLCSMSLIVCCWCLCDCDALYGILYGIQSVGRG